MKAKVDTGRSVRSIRRGELAVFVIAGKKYYWLAPEGRLSLHRVKWQ